MTNLRTTQNIHQIILNVANFNKFVQYVLPSYAAFLTGMPIPYLCNGISSVVTLGAGGSGYATTTFTIPLPYTAPSGSVSAVVTFTNTGGVLSAPVVTTPAPATAPLPPPSTTYPTLAIRALARPCSYPRPTPINPTTTLRSRPDCSSSTSAWTMPSSGRCYSGTSDATPLPGYQSTQARREAGTSREIPCW